VCWPGQSGRKLPIVVSSNFSSKRLFDASRIPTVNGTVRSAVEHSRRELAEYGLDARRAGVPLGFAGLITRALFRIGGACTNRRAAGFVVGVGAAGGANTSVAATAAPRPAFHVRLACFASAFIEAFAADPAAAVSASGGEWRNLNSLRHVPHAGQDWKSSASACILQGSA
jgi:hypothetical protein